MLTNCSVNNLDNNKTNLILKNNYINRGFTLVYNNSLFNEKIISKKIDERSLIIFQKNLKKIHKLKLQTC